MCILGEPTESKVVLGALRLALAAHLDARAASSTPRSARAGATRTRSCACARCSTRCSSGSRRWEDDPTSYRGASGDRRTSARSRAASAGASRARRTAPISSSTCAFRRRSRWPAARRKVLDFVRGLASASRLRRRGRGLRDGARARRSRRAIRSSPRSTTHTREVFGAPPERDVTRWFSDASVADALRDRRRSTTARRAASPTPSWARTSRSTAS